MAKECCCFVSVPLQLLAQRKKLSDASYDDIEMGIDICLVFFNTTYP